MTQLNQSIVDLSKAFVTRWLTWIRLFDFDVRHVSDKKHETVDELSRRFRTVSNDIDEINEIDIDDFINVEMNCVRIAFIRMTAAKERLFLSEYSNESKKITVWLIILNKSANMNIKQFLKFKMHALKHLIRKKHLFRRMNKNVFMRQMIDDQAIKTQILEAMHEESDHREKEEIYQKIATKYFWLEIMQNVKNHLKICDSCQRKAISKEKEILHFIWINVLWQKVCVDIVYILSFKKNHYLIFARKSFSKWIENKTFAKTDFESVARFIYENIICRHEYFERLMIDDDSENKKLIEIFIQNYRIKRLIVSVFHSQINEMIERKHISIKDVLSKLTLENEEKWIRHFYSVLWADRTTIKRFTDITFLQIITETKAVLFIELNVSIWQILFWKKIHTIVDFLILRAKQIQRKDENLKKTIMHLQRIKTEVKNFFDENHRIRTKNFRKIDMIMLHDIRLNNQHFEKLTFRWLKSFRIFQAFSQKDIYIIAKLDETELKNTVSENRLKKIYSRKTVNFEIFSKNENQFEVSLKNSNAKFVNSVLENDQLYSNEENLEYLMNEKDIPQTKIKVRIFVFSR